jgi:matrixin
VTASHGAASRLLVSSVAMSVLVVAFLASPAPGYVLQGTPGQRLQMTVDSYNLSALPFANAVAADPVATTFRAFQAWNDAGVGPIPIYDFFSPVSGTVTSPCARDGVNVVFSSLTACSGFGWGDAIAITYTWMGTDGKIAEGSILVNANVVWGDYPGPLQLLPDGRPHYDLYRVMLHEAGHLIGLGHEDNPAVSSIMASRISNVDSLQPDDIAGAHAVKFPSVPGATTLLSPSGTITDRTPVYTWSLVPDATWYYVWVDDTTGNRVKDWHTAASVCSRGTGTCSTGTSADLSNGAATWRVQTWNEAGFGPWSAPNSFIVDAAPPPGQAALVAPNGVIQTATPTYTWNAVPGSTWYHLWVNDSVGSPVVQWVTALDAGCPADTGVCSVKPTTVLANGNAQWWVRTWNADNGSGPWSDTMSFTVTRPDRTTLVSPSGAVATALPTYTWDPVPSSTWYYLWVNDVTGTPIRQWYRSSEVGCADGVSLCSVKSAVRLSAGAAAWWIQSWSTAGNGPWSAAMNFTVTPPSRPGRARLESPSGLIATNSPSYIWDAVAGSTDYYLWVNDRNGVRIKQWFTAAQVGCPNGTGVCTASPAIPLASGAARWWIQTWNETGYGPWSDLRDFTVP